MVARYDFLLGVIHHYHTSITNVIAGEEASRKWGPLVRRDQWNAYLLNAGFSGVDVSIENPRGEPLWGGGAMISTAIDIAKTGSLQLKTVIVTSGGSSFQQTVAYSIKAELEKTQSVHCVVIDLSDVKSIDLSESTCIFIPELEKPLLHRITRSSYVDLQKLISRSQGILWATVEGAHDPTNQMVLGFARCVREEIKSLRFVTLSLHRPEVTSAVVKNIVQVYQSTMLTQSEGYEREYVEKDGMLWINRVVEAGHVDDHVRCQTIVQPSELQALSPYRLRPLKLTVGTAGMLDTLEFTDDLQSRLTLASDEVEIEVKASGLNFRDVLIALGQVNGNNVGGECAGIVTRAGENTDFTAGDRVVSVVEGSFTTLARGKALTTCKIPDGISFTSAAGIPSIFCTAHYALSHWGRMKPGESILIHSAAGGFGQAVIQFAQLHNVEIYATVGNEEKKQLLIDTYKIKKDHIFSSRTRSFVYGIKRMTKDRGVDVVVNSLAGEALRCSWECVAPFGRFIEVGKKDILAYENLPMHPFAKNVTFTCVDLDHLVHENRKLAGTLLHEVMELYHQGKIFDPTPLHIFTTSRVEEAFRYMQSGKNTGKIVVELNEGDIVPVRRQSSPDVQDAKSIGIDGPICAAYIWFRPKRNVPNIWWLRRPWTLYCSLDGESKCEPFDPIRSSWSSKRCGSNAHGRTEIARCQCLRSTL